jgi:hypothetical protein
MKKISFFSIIAASAALALGMIGTANATPVYSTPGTINPDLYSFTAASSGTITAYFAGSTASYDNKLTMLVNGVATGILGLDDHTSVIGQSLVLGSVVAGDNIVFELITLEFNGSSVGPWYSDRSLNSDGVNHVFSTSWDGDGSVPAGTYVAFEDLVHGGDKNYNDEDFVFTNTSSEFHADAATTPVPEPSSLLLLCTGLGVILVSRKRFHNVRAGSSVA